MAIDLFWSCIWSRCDIFSSFTLFSNNNKNWFDSKNKLTCHATPCHAMAYMPVSCVSECVRVYVSLSLWPCLSWVENKFHVVWHFFCGVVVVSKHFPPGSPFDFVYWFSHKKRPPATPPRSSAPAHCYGWNWPTDGHMSNGLGFRFFIFIWWKLIHRNETIKIPNVISTSMLWITKVTTVQLNKVISV